MEESNNITLGEYIEKGKKGFVIPCYQRGYIWGKCRDDGGEDSVTKITKHILAQYKDKKEIFLQGVTVSRDEQERIVIIDGQQRTTYFYLLLRYLGYSESFPIEYKVRKETENYLNNLPRDNRKRLRELCKENNEEDFQDLYFMKKTVRIIDKILFDELKGEDEYKELTKYLLEKVKFLYIPLSPDISCEDVFSMMNGNRAVMTTEELIKAELLRNLGRKGEDGVFDYNIMRGRYAREWDRWLYWWKRSEVRVFYHVDDESGILGLLLTTYMRQIADKDNMELKFESFRECLRDRKPEEVFYGLRKLQKGFEDVYNSVGDGKELHNKIGAILTVHGADNRKRFIRWYFCSGEKDKDIDRYYRYAFLGLSHGVIQRALENGQEDVDKVKERISEVKDGLSSSDVYNSEYKDLAFKQLLRRNIDEDNKLGRKFNFAVYDARSLEHIHPKSKFFSKSKDSLSADEIKKKEEDGYLNRDDFSSGCSEHCIGNLVLLVKNDNSKFSDSSFEEKKEIYFGKTSEALESRNLLHSMLVFSSSKWGKEEIEENKKNVIKEFNDCYGAGDTSK